MLLHSASDISHLEYSAGSGGEGVLEKDLVRFKRPQCSLHKLNLLISLQAILRVSDLRCDSFSVSSINYIRYVVNVVKLLYIMAS